MNKLYKYLIWINLPLLMVLFFEGNSQVIFQSSNLPIVFIETDGQTLVPDTNKVVNMGIIYNGPGEINFIGDPYNDYDGKIAIRIRGNSSLAFPKKSFTIETQDSNGQNLNVSLIDLPKENDWVLYAPYSDKSLMRNVLIYELARRMGWYAPRTKYCELFLDDEYQGIYVLIEKIKRDDDRVDIAKITANDTIGNELTGGYIILRDRYDGDGWHSNVNWDVFFEYYEPDDDKILEVQKEYIQHFINIFEYKLNSLSQLDDTTFTSTIDFKSFYDYIILNEISKNVDAYKLSVYMFKDKNSKDGRLKMGPIWDYNIAFGNNHDFNGYTTSDFIYSDSAFSDYAIFWFNKLMSFTLFQDNIKNRWNELRLTTLHTDSIYSIIDSCYLLLSEAQERNFTKWDILGEYVWPNYYYGDTYEEDVEFLKTWIDARLDWMDDSFSTDIPENRHNTPFNIYPNPFKNQIYIDINIPQISTMKFILYDSFGRSLYQHEFKEYNLLQNSLDLNFEGLNLSNGFYFYHIIWNEDNVYQGKLIKLK